MVVTQSRKKVKYTYAERVLGALSQAQKEHKKHAVHLATIRAQVRRTAEARKDKLGPQWSNWVTRTVNKLVEQGVLQTSDSSGHLMFTPFAKKAISESRREVAVPISDTDSSSAVENHVWKDVTHQISRRGVKRSRRRSSVGGAALLGSVSEGEDEVIRTPSRKRTRKQGRISMPRMNKAELEAERLSLRRAEAEKTVSRRARAPVDKEVLRLRKALEACEAEISTLRDELVQIKGASLNTEGEYASPPTRPHTPEHDVCTPSPPQRNRVVRITRVQPLGGVTRTESGSFISNISKQPTPAPSSPGMRDVDIEDLAFGAPDDQLSVLSSEADLQERAPLVHPHGLVTPPRTSPFEVDEAENNFEMDRGIESGLVFGALEREQLMKEVAHLKADIQSRTAEFSGLRAEHASLAAEHKELQALLSSRNSRLDILQAEVEQTRQSLARSDSVAEDLRESLEAEKSRLLAAERAAKTANDSLVKECKLRSALAAEKSTLSATVDRLNEAAQQSRAQVDHLCMEVERLEAECVEVRNSQTAAEDKLAQATTRNVALTSDLGSAHDVSECLSRDLAVSKSMHAAVTAELEHAKATIEKLSGQLAAANGALQQKDVSVAELENRRSRLEQDNSATRSQISTLEAYNSTLQQDILGLNATVESLQVELRAATGESAHLASRLAEKEATEDELRSSLARALADASTAVHEITEIKVTVSEQQLSLDQVRSLLQEKEIEATELGDRLVKTEAARNELLSELGEKAGQITTLRENVAAATVVEEELRRSLAALKDQQAADMSKHTAQLSSLQGSLFTATDEVGALRTQLDTAETSRVELIARLEEAGAEALSLQDTLQREKERSATLTQDLSLAKTDAQDAEAEIEALLKAKAEDEASISRLKDGFSRLRQVQMECLVEVDHKIAAAHSSPLPNRRRSSVVPNTHQLNGVMIS